MPTMRDVAKLAGVGIGTVSRVINNTGYVSKETYEVVMNAVKQLDYVPNEMARSLKAKGNRIIAIFLPRIYDSFFSELAFYIEDELYKLDYKLMVCNSDGDLAKETDYINMLRQKQVEGIIGISGSEMNELVDPSMPIVTIDRHLFPKMTVISSDNYEGGQLALKELKKNGCSNVCYIGHTNGHVISEWQKRKVGFEDACKTHGINHMQILRDDPVTDYREIVETLYKKMPAVDGLFVENDRFALKIIKELQGLNVRIPEDLCVIGFDGLEILDFVHPSLSTIAQPIEEMGRTVVRSLINIINNKGAKKRIVLPVKYIKGETTRI